MFLRILHRYIIADLLRVFLMALAALSFILVIALLVAEASQQGLPPGQVIRLMPLLVPGTLPFTIPTAALFAVAVVYGRLSHDNEITAIRSAGVPVTRILWPAFMLGGVCSVAVFVLYDEVIPRATHAFKTAVVRDIEELLYAKLRRDLCFQTPGVNYAIFVKEVQGRRLLEATFEKNDSGGGHEFVIVAREAEIRVDLARNEVMVALRHGEMIRSDGTHVFIEHETIRVPLPPNLGPNRLARARELTNAQLARQIAELGQERTRLRGKLPQESATLRLPNDLQAVSEERFLLHVADHRQWEMETEYASRPAVSVGCFFFVLIGCPVAIWFHRRDYLSAFVTCFLPIIITYYPLMMFSMNLSKDGRLDPWILMWVGDALLGVAGLILLWRLTRH